MYVMLSHDGDKFTVLDTSDGIVEEFTKTQLVSFLKSNQSVSIDGFRYLTEDGRISVRNSELHYEGCNGYCLVYSITNKGTLNVKVPLTVYEMGTGNKIYSDIVCGSKSDYINCSVEHYVESGVDVCVVSLEYYDKHYYHEDNGIELSYIVKLKRTSSGNYNREVNSGWLPDNYAWFNERTGRVQIG